MAEKLKDQFFTRSFITKLGVAIQVVNADFDPAEISHCVFDDLWESRELKARLRHVAHCLHATLPQDYPVALDILREVAPAFHGFDAMVFPEFVGIYGLDHWDVSLSALEDFTKLCSSEFGIRPYLIQDPKKAMTYLVKWAQDKDQHVRRLASEGCRPRLPWAMALPAFKQDPRPILPILEILKDDESDYVRRSVANNLNDISKDHPDLVLDTCERWIGQSDNTDWTIRHACRGLLKAGHKRALALFGFSDPVDLEVTNFDLDRHEIEIGEAVRYSFELHVKTEAACKVRVELAVDYVKAKGKLSRKLFHVTEGTFEPGGHRFERSHSFHDLSTRKHYPGEHFLSILVNSEEKAQSSVFVTKSLTGMQYL